MIDSLLGSLRLRFAHATAVALRERNRPADIDIADVLTAVWTDSDQARHLAPPLEDMYF